MKTKLLFLMLFQSLMLIANVKAGVDQAIDLGEEFKIELRDDVVVSYNFLAIDNLPTIPGITPEQMKGTKTTKIIHEIVGLDGGLRVYIQAYLLPNGYVKLIAANGDKGGTLYISSSNIISITTYKRRKSPSK